MDRPVRLLVVASALALAGCGSTGRSSDSAASVDPGLSLARCMRSHGVPNFPDPNSSGAIRLDSGSGIDPASPAFQAAQKACRAYGLAKGGRPPAMSASQRAHAFAFAKCMRAHGQEDFPDPTIGTPTPTTGRTLVLPGMFFAVGPNFNPKTPGFRQAAAACGLTLPGS